MHRRNLARALTALWLCAASSVMAAPPDGPYADRGTFSLVFENDNIAGTDRNYTNGLALAYLSPRNRVPGASRWLAERWLGADTDDGVYAGLGLAHSIYTPRDTQRTRPLPDQHPYAAWLHATALTAVDRGHALDTLTLDLGVVGPAAGGEWLQNNVHELIGVDEARGWAYQVRNEPGFVLGYERKWRALGRWRALGLEADLLPSAGVSLGNVLTQAQTGLMVRVGQDLANDYGPPRVSPAQAGAGFFTPRDRLSWYLFAGAVGRAVAYNIVLDGNAFREGGPRVDREPLVAEAQAGLVVQAGRVQAAFTVVLRTDEFSRQDQQQLFGALSFSMKL